MKEAESKLAADAKRWGGAVACWRLTATRRLQQLEAQLQGSGELKKCASVPSVARELSGVCSKLASSEQAVAAQKQQAALLDKEVARLKESVAVS